MANKVLIVVGVLVLLVAIQTYFILDGMTSGKWLALIRPQIILSADAPWHAYPPALKEYISANAALDTKLNKQDMLQISAYYKALADSYKEPVSVRTLKQKEKEAKDGQAN